MAGGGPVPAEQKHNDGRMELLKAFDETLADVKCLADSGVSKIPEIFVRPSEELDQDLPVADHQHQLEIPVIDLSGVESNAMRRKEIVEQVGNAAEKWGFFQVVNHGIPLTVIDAVIEGVKKFHEQDDAEEKKKYYTSDVNRRVRFNSFVDLFSSKIARWKDTLTVNFPHDQPHDQVELPDYCRDSIVDYSKHAKDLGSTLLELLSEALGLESDRLKNMECLHEHLLHCHYYPACPAPQLTIGTVKHSDVDFLTILLQNQVVSGLQVLHQGQWIDIQPIPGGLVINIGDLLELVSNGKFKSAIHRAISNITGPRISVGCFFSGDLNGTTVYGPIEELISKENPPKYKEVVIREYVRKYRTTGRDDYIGLDYYRI